MTTTEDHHAIARVLTTYARACDVRRWELLDEVFTDDVTWATGGDEVAGRVWVASMRTHLDRCGPTQHLLGNFVIDVEGDEATSSRAGR